MQTKDTWLERYAFKSYVPATDNPEQFGWTTMPVDEAMSRRFIITNPAKLTSMLVIDVDRQDAEREILSRAWDDEDIPEPNWITTNLATTHAHAGYWLDTPVSTSDMSSYKARTYLYDVQRRLTHALGGDIRYSHHVTRSPFRLGHHTQFPRDETYSLKELASTLKDIKLLPTYSVDTTQGRNVALFDIVRERAYKDYKKFRTQSELFVYLEGVAQETNVRLNAERLPEHEVRSVARSIARWTWRRFSEKKFSAKQTYLVNKRWEKVKRGDITNEKRLMSLAEVREEIVFLRGRGLSHSEIANLTGLTKDQVKSRLQYARKLEELEQ